MAKFGFNDQIWVQPIAKFVFNQWPKLGLTNDQIWIQPIAKFGFNQWPKLGLTNGQIWINGQIGSNLKQKLPNFGSSDGQICD